MSVIIGDRDNPYGILGVHTNQYRKFEPQDVDFLQSVANVLGEAIQRRDAEEALKRNQVRYQALFDNVNDAVFIIGLDQIYLAANQQAADRLGYKIDEIIGMPINNLIKSGEVEDSKKVYQAIKAGKKLPIYERTALAKSGEEIPIEVDVAMVYGPH